MKSDHVCTYFDHRYAAPGLALLRSLREQGGNGPVWVFCLSPEAEEVVAGFDLGDIRIVPLTALERHFPALAAAKADRSQIEYYFTLTPHVIRYVFDHAPEAERVAYLDGDLYFFGAVAEVWRAAGDAPVAIIPHNFHKGAEHLAKHGVYNVGWVSFRQSEQGDACLDYWASSCRDWCSDTPEPGRFADQGYLDSFHLHAPNLAVIRHKGCNVGPWNVGRYRFRHEAGRVWVDEDPLIFFHFTGFKPGPGGRWYNSHRLYRAGTPAIVRDQIYRPYLAALLAARAFVAPLMPPSPDAGQLKRNRGGGAGLKARAYKAAEQAFRLLDLISGKSIREP